MKVLEFSMDSTLIAMAILTLMLQVVLKLLVAVGGLLVTTLYTDYNVLKRYFQLAMPLSN